MQLNNILHILRQSCHQLKCLKTLERASSELRISLRYLDKILEKFRLQTFTSVNLHCK